MTNHIIIKIVVIPNPHMIMKISVINKLTMSSIFKMIRLLLNFNFFDRIRNKKKPIKIIIINKILLIKNILTPAFFNDTLL